MTHAACETMLMVEPCVRNYESGAPVDPNQTRCAVWQQMCTTCSSVSPHERLVTSAISRPTSETEPASGKFDPHMIRSAPKAPIASRTNSSMAAYGYEHHIDMPDKVTRTRAS